MSGKSNLLLSFAPTDPMAEAAYRFFKDTDPFPEIEPALLNSADIADYVSKTGMIYPFDPYRLGPASYEMVLGGEVLSWDEQKIRCRINKLENNQPLLLKRNSITYVSVRETFRLPHYIAVRFNLRVKHVHRGLLLGTGPLVDPGYQGNLMIPIHNLTDNEYVIYEGEDLISVEFTKVSRNKRFILEKDSAEGRNLALLKRHGVFKENSGRKSKKNFEELLRKSLPIDTGKVMSSLSGTLSETKIQLDNNENYITNLKRALGVGIFFAVAATATLYYDIKSYVADANKYVADATMLYKKTDNIDIRSIAKTSEVEELSAKIDALQKQLNDLAGVYGL